MRMTEQQFRTAMSNLPEPPDGSRPPYWEAWRRQLWELGKTSDPTQFMGWPPVYHTMLVNHWPTHMETEFCAIPQEWMEAAEMPHFGSPPDYHGSTPYSRNLIHQLYHLKRFEDESGVRVRELRRIDEFGGGYGAMAQVVHRLGFRGDYRIYDLPEFALLQQYYLSQFDIPVSHHSDPEGKTDLLIACYSLSETPIPFRNQFLGRLEARNYLLLYSNRFAEYDNTGYFDGMVTRFPFHVWHTEHIRHLPPQSLYKFGYKKRDDGQSV